MAPLVPCVENPRVGSSILPLATSKNEKAPTVMLWGLFSIAGSTSSLKLQAGNPNTALMFPEAVNQNLR
jgi:hypothetical protein